MLNSSIKTKYNKSFLPILLLAVPLSASAFSFSFLKSFFAPEREMNDQSTSKQESLQNLKVFEPNKFFATDVVAKGETSFDPHPEFVDDLDSGISENHGENAIYTVQRGDSINSIASYFGVSVDTILTFNHLPSRTVHVDDVLEVPSVSGVLYEVKKGDTLAGISKKYKIDSEDVALYNGLQDDMSLSIGDEIFLPSAQEDTKMKQTTTTKTSSGKTTIKTSIVSSFSSYIPSRWDRGDTSHLNTPDKVAKYSSLQKLAGYYIFPTPGATRTQKLHGNNGCDLANKLGSPVLAAASGVVTVAKTGGYNFGYGNYIKIKHPNGTETLYGHLSRVDVSVGQSVSQAEQIGAVGSTGNSTGPHLHFEVHGAYNPFAW